MALALRQSLMGVILGSIAGHLMCTLIAVLGGRWAAGRLSERLLTWMGGLLFIVFGAITLISPVV